MHVGLDRPGLPASPEKPETGVCSLLALKGWAISTSKSERAKHNALQARGPAGRHRGGKQPLAPSAEAGGFVLALPRGEMSLQASPVAAGVQGLPSLAGLGDRWLKKPFWLPRGKLLPPARLCHARSCPGSTHHADLSGHEVAQPVEPFHVSLQVLGLITETGLREMKGLHSVFRSMIFGT